MEYTDFFKTLFEFKSEITIPASRRIVSNLHLRRTCKLRDVANFKPQDHFHSFEISTQWECWQC